ncbi:peroxiredoxin [Sphingomonas sp. ID0503]|uniref:peroxiredoxin n=1 Tax=Sphingomonas sp. ID0503 TaxID=3399691 RepID=UPI003AFAA687
MTISVGERVPDVPLFRMGDAGVEAISTATLFAGRMVVLFAVPGAFTPTCSAQHLPGFIEAADALHARGVDEIACLSVNDAFVMEAWGRSAGSSGKVTMLADGNGDFTRALGLEIDARKNGLGMRSRRYSMVVEDGFVTHLNLDEPGAFKISAASHLLEQL